MRKTKHITLTLVASLAASMTACQDPQEEMKHCVDQDGVVVEDHYCNDSPPVHSGGGSVPVPITRHRWYYGGGYQHPLTPGSRPIGGSYNPTPGKSYSSPTVGVSRGGFGSTGKGVSGGHGGGE